jgi:hypothetical protein
MRERPDGQPLMHGSVAVRYATVRRSRNVFDGTTPWHQKHELCSHPRIGKEDPGVAFGDVGQQGPHIDLSGRKRKIRSLESGHQFQPDAFPPCRLPNHVDGESARRTVATDQTVGRGVVQSNPKDPIPAVFEKAARFPG